MSAPGQTEAVREPQVRLWLSELEKDVASIEAILDVLLQRMQTVMRPVNPTPISGQKEIVEQLAPVADSIRAASTKLRQQRALLESALDRLEV